uniref:Uncharacterized protein n=1 Tax=Arundo donax TaxID=35708 RepID=A0A0A8YPT2_ARUDO
MQFLVFFCHWVSTSLLKEETDC